jgi:DNA mismatch repair protein MutL
MSSIHALPDDVVSKIAAGEVVERPAFAVKELIENSIDANATAITIDIEESGLKKIAVIDNGQGMDKDDLSLSFLPHTTSKIAGMDELAKVSSFGFRGEALHSIAAISRMVVQSRTTDMPGGSEIFIEGGVPQIVKKIGMPIGTSIFVYDLFFNTPVRKKFLKSGASESRHILEIIMQMALAHPAIGFKLVHNGKTIIDLPREQDLEERMSIILGNSLARDLLPIFLTQDDIQIHGFISRPLAVTAGNKPFLFVNKRPVQYQLLSSIIKQAYGTLLEPRAFPFYLFFITLPHQYVDVNVHPRKEQVHLANEQTVIDFVRTAVTTTLQANNLTYQFRNEEMDALRDGGTHTYAAELLKDEVEPWGKETSKVTGDVLQIHNLYLVVQTKKGAMMVDQHAAHERILYEQFLEEFEKQKTKKDIYTLKKAEMVDMSLSDAETVREYLPELQELGFDIEEFGTNLFKINAIPKLFMDRNISELLLEAVHDLQSGIGLKNVDIRSHKMLSYLACRTAIKSGDKLTKEQMKDLINKLAETKTQYTCPHGRPVKIDISMRELERMFKRSGF